MTAMSGTVIVVAIVAAVWWAQVLFVPLALAVFLAFLLNPVVRALQHRGLGRVSSVLVVVIWATLLLAALSWVVGRQVSSLMAELPDHTAKIKAKIQAVKQQSGTLGRLGAMIDEISGELKSSPAAEPASEPLNPRSLPAVAELGPTLIPQPGPPSWVRQVRAPFSPPPATLPSL